MGRKGERYTEGKVERMELMEKERKARKERGRDWN